MVLLLVVLLVISGMAWLAKVSAENKEFLAGQPAPTCEVVSMSDQTPSRMELVHDVALRVDHMDEAGKYGLL